MYAMIPFPQAPYGSGQLSVRDDEFPFAAAYSAWEIGAIEVMYSH